MISGDIYKATWVKESRGSTSSVRIFTDYIAPTQFTAVTPLWCGERDITLHPS